MKKFSLIIAAIAIALITSSSFSNRNAALEIGKQMPLTNVQGADDAMNLSTLHGQWVILSFWSAADAASRIAASQTYRNAEALNADINFVSVNLDRSEALMNEIAQIDGIGGTLLHITDTDAAMQLRRKFSMNSGLRTLLIDPEGRLAAVDPTPEQINRLII